MKHNAKPVKGSKMPLMRAFIAYKKVYSYHKDSDFGYGRSVILTLLIPASAKRYQHFYTYHFYDKKCRADKVYVLKAEYLRSKSKVTGKLVSSFDKSYEYVVGKWHKPKKRFNNHKQTCGSGIHFFLRKSQAREY